jgi:hypothetical protein
LLLRGDVTKKLKQFEFTKHVRDNYILDDLVHKIYEQDPKRILDTQHLKLAIRFCDKSLYQKFRDYQITYDQLLSRVEEARFGTKYVVLDDIKGTSLDLKYLE